MRKPIFVLALLLVVSMLGCGSKSSPVTTTPPPSTSKPLDPQGNWIFTITGSSETLVYAGQLYELTSPVVTSNPLGYVSGDSFCNTSFNVAGQASGTATINLTATQTATQIPLILSLTGTIADSQAGMSGTWTNTSSAQCMGGQTSGTWSAQTLAPVTGTWSGTLNSSGATISVSLALTEDTLQTDPDMGQVTGTVTISGSACYNVSTPLTIPAWTDNGTSLHAGETLLIATAPDSNNSTIQSVGLVDTGATTYTIASFVVFGGPCDGQNFSGTLTLQ